MAALFEFKREIKKAGTGEGCVTHMYLDSVGKVTVGVGNMLPDAASAAKLNFVVRATRAKATPEQVQADFNAVSGQPRGYRANWYKQHTALDFPVMEADRLLDRRIAEFRLQVRGRFRQFDSYPTSAQMAILDMAFNLGTNGLWTKFPNLRRAIEAREWETAAKESSRRGVPAARNALVRKWFEQAALQGASPAR